MTIFTQKNSNATLTELKTIVNNSFDEVKRIKSINLLKELATKNDNFFTFLENLLISESNPEVRNVALKILKKYYLKKAFDPLCWAYEHEDSIECLLNIISILGEINSERSHEFFLEKLSNIEISEFHEYLERFLEVKDPKNSNIKEMAQVLKYYNIIKNFMSLFELIRYKIEKGRIVELDFSFLYNNGFTESIIRQLPAIIRNLKDLRSLNLKYNKLKKFPDFVKNLTNLKYLNLSHNQISTIPKNITEMSSLTHLDLSWNNLHSIPHEIIQLDNLKLLNISNNCFISMNNPLSQLHKEGIKILY
jgi:hypothetical protein